MIDREHDLPLKQQAVALGISRSSVYYRPRPISAEDLWLMRRIDELHLNYPFAGSRMLRDLLWQQGLVVGRRHIATLMRRMCIEAIYRRPNTSKPAPGHRIYPYLLRGLAVTRPNQVWAMDITYIPMARGFVYLAAVVDWFSRRVLAWKLSITMETSFCIEALEEALSVWRQLIFPVVLPHSEMLPKNLTCFWPRFWNRRVDENPSTGRTILQDTVPGWQSGGRLWWRPTCQGIL